MKINQETGLEDQGFKFWVVYTYEVELKWIKMKTYLF